MLTILPISSSGIKKSPKTNFIMSPNLKGDVFKRNNEISFKGKEADSFIQWAQETSFVDQIGDILTNPDLKIGSGFHNNVYKIPGNDDYVLRTGLFVTNYMNAIPLSRYRMVDIEDKKMKINIGQKVARIELHSPYQILEFEVLKKQSGKPLGVKCREAIVKKDGTLQENELPYEHITRRKYYADSIHSVSQLPLSAYDKLIADLIVAHKAGYSFDATNSNNLLIDEEKQEINLVDMSKYKSRISWKKVLLALTNRAYFETYADQKNEFSSSIEENEQVKQDTAIIIEKFSEALRKRKIWFRRPKELNLA